MTPSSRTEALAEALKKIVEIGTRNETRRISDPYSDGGWENITTESDEAEIAREALAAYAASQTDAAIPEPIYRAVERVLDECSAWIARPDAEVTKRVALVAGIAWSLHNPPKDDPWEIHDALHDLIMLKAQEDIGSVPPPTKEQWEKAWRTAEEFFEP